MNSEFSELFMLYLHIIFVGDKVKTATETHLTRALITTTIDGDTQHLM